MELDAIIERNKSWADEPAMAIQYDYRELQNMGWLTCYGHPRVEGVVGGLVLHGLGGGGGARERALVAPRQRAARAGGLAVPRLWGTRGRTHQRP